MVECNSIECNSNEYNSVESTEHNSIDTSNLNNQQFRLNKISEIEDYFIAEINDRELMSKKLIFSKKLIYLYLYLYFIFLFLIILINL